MSANPSTVVTAACYMASVQQLAVACSDVTLTLWSCDLSSGKHVMLKKAHTRTPQWTMAYQDVRECVSDLANRLISREILI